MLYQFFFYVEQKMQITLSTTPALESWGKNAILSFNQDQAVIHLKDDEKIEPCFSSKSRT